MNPEETTHWSDALVTLDACADAVAWCRTQPDLDTAWRDCPRADWSLWLVENLNPSPAPGSAEHRRRVGCGAEIARTVLDLFEAECPSDSRVRDCLDASDRFAAGEYVDLAPAGAAAEDAAEDAAAATAWGAQAAWAAARAAGAAAGAAARAAAERAAAARAAARAAHAKIVRRWYPQAPKLEQTK